jgi:periplasmic protein TonB
MKKLLFLLSLSACSTLFAQQADTLKTPEQITDSIFQKVEAEAYFPGGDEAWNKYMLQKVQANIDKLMNKKSYGTCEVQFIVDTDGSVSNIEALTLKNSFLAKVLVNAIKGGPRWIPATINNKPVKAWRRQKVTFRAPVD